MKKALVIFIFMALSVNILAQGNDDDKIKELYDNEEYETIVKEYTSKDANYSATSLFYIGTAYHMLNDDENCIKYIDVSLDKDSSNPGAYYIKATSLNYLEKYEDAIPVFQRAIVLESDKEHIAGSYRGLGYSYYTLKQYDQALEAYNKAIELNKTVATPYIMVAQIYSDTNQDDKVLEAYYNGKDNASKEADNYITILFNIGLIEQLKGNQDKALAAYNELIEIDPSDYHTYAKIIQAHYHNKEYDKAEPLKEKLYKAHKENTLPENMQDMFCIDQFEWEGKAIRVFERYEDGHNKSIYYKIIFYILNEENRIDYTIQTEYSPAAVTMKEGMYMLCASKGSRHINYGIVLKENPKYENIKNMVLEILEKEKNNVENEDEE